MQTKEARTFQPFSSPHGIRIIRWLIFFNLVSFLYDTTIQTIFRMVESQQLKKTKQTNKNREKEREREREMILYALLSSKQIFHLTKLLKLSNF